MDPGDQLRWLVAELVDAEFNDEKVHIVGHIAPDPTECTRPWLANFLAILERFQTVIAAQFYGHSHKDEFRVYYGRDGKSVLSSAFIGPSLTSYVKRKSGLQVAVKRPSKGADRATHSPRQSYFVFFTTTRFSARFAADRYKGNNPAYRLYHIDGSARSTVKDHATYFFNLTDANLSLLPIWRKLYTFTSSYALSSASHEDLDYLLQLMKTDDELFQLFYR